MTERRYEGGPDGGREPTDAEVDEIFAAIVADWRRPSGSGSAADPEPEPAAPTPPAPPAGTVPQPLPRPPVPRRPQPTGWEEPYERYRPELVPLGRPHWPILAGWIAMALAVVATLLAVFGVPLPNWVGWICVGGFLGGFGLLVSQLPRHRPPSAGDGAVL